MQFVIHPIIGPKKEMHDIDGRVANITGGAFGIGYEIALVACDLGSLKEVKEVFTGLRDREKRLDLYGKDANGIDRHFGVNWLGQFNTTNLLYPLLRATSKIPDTPAPRIVFEASEKYRTAPSNVHLPHWTRSMIRTLAILNFMGEQKLAIILVVKYGIFEGVNTAMQQLWKDAYPGLLCKLITSVMLAGGRDVEQGSYSVLYTAAGPEGMPRKESSQASDPTLGDALWDLSERIIKDKVGSDALVDWNSS
ncbi:hypothetical protein B0O99DRAFT_647640 [Bisporella sp. PMI_857]|nr:hypothetical protein B0O99DRAFT_647640 [Bisporella sp. PMI_857]